MSSLLVPLSGGLAAHFPLGEGSDPPGVAPSSDAWLDWEDATGEKVRLRVLTSLARYCPILFRDDLAGDSVIGISTTPRDVLLACVPAEEGGHLFRDFTG